MTIPRSARWRGPLERVLDFNIVKIYTRTGDDGTTGLLGPGRVLKSSARVEAYGSVDELNAALGAASALDRDGWLTEPITALQTQLFAIGAELAATTPASLRSSGSPTRRWKRWKPPSIDTRPIFPRSHASSFPAAPIWARSSIGVVPSVAAPSVDWCRCIWRSRSSRA